MLPRYKERCQLVHCSKPMNKRPNIGMKIWEKPRDMVRTVSDGLRIYIPPVSRQNRANVLVPRPKYFPSAGLRGCACNVDCKYNYTVPHQQDLAQARLAGHSRRRKLERPRMSKSCPSPMRFQTPMNCMSQLQISCLARINHCIECLYTLQMGRDQ